MGVVDRRGLACFWLNRLTYNSPAFLPIIPNPKWELSAYHADAGTGTVPTHDGGHIPVQYKDYVDIFSSDRAKTLAPHRQIDHVIDMLPSFNIPYGRIYNPSEVKLKPFKAAYIETNIAYRFIQ